MMDHVLLDHPTLGATIATFERDHQLRGFVVSLLILQVILGLLAISVDSILWALVALIGLATVPLLLEWLFFQSEFLAKRVEVYQRGVLIVTRREAITIPWPCLTITAYDVTEAGCWFTVRDHFGVTHHLNAIQDHHALYELITANLSVEHAR